MQTGEQKQWRVFATTFIVTIAVLFPTLMIGLFVLDPYGTRRVTLIDPPGVRAQGTRTEHASRARDHSFDFVIIGNSRMQALHPERLTQLTGANFASLTIPGTRPKEQLTMLDWYLRHREASPRVILLGTDIFWCYGDKTLKTVNPFPFWLYEEDTLAYARGLVRFNALEEGVRRIEYAIGGRDRARPDGYWDYDPIYVAHGHEEAEKQHLLLQYKPEDVVNLTGQFPALEMLRDMLPRVPSDTLVVFMVPPTFVSGQPREGTPEHATEQACYSALTEIAQSRPRTIVIDWNGVRPETEDPAFYFDQIHYKGKLARVLEETLAARINADLELIPAKLMAKPYRKLRTDMVN